MQVKKKHVSFLLIVIFLALGSADGDAQNPTPATPLANCTGLLGASANLMPFDVSSLNCFNVWSSQDFILMYNESNPGEWSFILSAPDSGGWIGVGFSPNGEMVKSSAIVGWITTTGMGMAKQYYLAGETPMACKPDTGVLQLTPNKTLIVKQSSRLYLAFQLTNTTLPLTNLIYAVGPNRAVPGSDYLLEEHTAEVSTKIDYNSGTETKKGDGDAQNPTPATPSANCLGLLGASANLMPFDVSSLNCFTAWSSQDFILMYNESNPGEWSFILSAPDSGGWIGVGFSPNGGMVKSSAIVGWITSTGMGMAKQYYLAGETSKECKPDTGVLQLTPNKTLIVKQSSRLYLAFQLTNTTLPLTNLIYAVGPNRAIPGSDYLLEEHTAEVSTKIDYKSGAVEEEANSNTLQTSHQLLTLIGWGIILPIGVLMARYFKNWDPMWFYSHMIIQGIGFVVGLAGIITGFKLEDKTGEQVDTHKTIGIVVLVLGSLQVMAVLARPDKSSKVRKYWNWYHHYVGRAGIVLAIANIFYGFSLAGEENSRKIGYGVFLGAWGLVSLALETRMCMSKE